MHIFSVFIMKDTARILQWDRSSMMMMEAITYNESHLIAEFFHHYLVASPEMRGNDQLVSNPMLSEALAAREILELDNEVPLVKLQIPDAKGSPLHFITCAP
jgi:hypothetical protein